MNQSVSGNVLTLPARLYHDAEVYERERHAVFYGQWLIFTHESPLEKPGSYVAQTLAGWPVFVIRDKNNELKGFHNVCRHRASQILKDGQGQAGALRCLYHGWVYDTQGCLQKAPGFGGDEKKLCENTSLFPVHVRVWNGLVFVCLNGEKPAPDFESALGDLPAALAGRDLGAFKYFDGASHILKCNWKTYIENYMEGYHIPAVHPGLNAEVDFSTYRVEPGNRIARHLVNTKTEDALNDGLWIWLWPNAALNIYRNGMNLEIVLPRGPEETELRYIYLFTDISEVAAADNARTIAMSRTVTQEDIEICEIVQRNLRAGVYDRGELSPRHEGGVAYFQSLVADALR